MQLTIANGQVIWILVLLFSLPLVNTRSVFASISKDPAKDHSSQCDCFITSGPEPGFYKYHRFFDFRDIADTTNNVSSPPNTQSKDKVGAPNSRDKFLNTAPFSDFWQIQHWTKPVTDAAPLPLVNSGQNLYISRESEMMGNSTYLTLRTHRLPGFVSGAEIQSLQQNIYHGSFRVRMRIIPNSSNFFGVIITFFQICGRLGSLNLVGRCFTRRLCWLLHILLTNFGIGHRDPYERRPIQDSLHKSTRSQLSDTRYDPGSFVEGRYASICILD